MSEPDQPSLPAPSSTTRDTLLDAAEQLFGERGYAAVGTREIAERANANIASIKYHFGCKSELYLATVRRAMGKSDAGNVWNFLKPASSEPVDAAAALARFIHEMLRKHLMCREPNPCCNFMLREAMEPSEAIDVVVRDYIQPYQQMLMEVIAVIAPKHSQDQLRLTASSILGQVMHYRVFRAFVERMHTQPLDEESRVEQIAQHIARFSLAGLGCDGSLISRALERSKQHQVKDHAQARGPAAVLEGSLP